jgi:prephenate dehydrogenase
MYQMAEMASNPMNPAAMVAMKFLEGMRVTADMFFKEFDVGRRDTLNPELSGGIYEQNMQRLQGMVQQLEQQLQQMQQAGQGMQMELAQKNQELQSLQSGLAGNPAVVSRMG